LSSFSLSFSFPFFLVFCFQVASGAVFFLRDKPRGRTLVPSVALPSDKASAKGRFEVMADEAAQEVESNPDFSRGFGTAGLKPRPSTGVQTW
jgi:hypothetical protein